MRFALLGDHPDGQALARALVSAGHTFLSVSAIPKNSSFLESWQGSPLAFFRDPEEILADPAVELIIVAGKLADRPHLLRRALQSERHVLCVYPPDQTPDIGYEAALIQADTRMVLLPLLPHKFHPGVAKLKELMGEGNCLGPIGVIKMEIDQKESNPGSPTRKRGKVLHGLKQAPLAYASGFQGGSQGESSPAPYTSSRSTPRLDCWEILRLLGGEIAEVFATTAEEETIGDAPVLVAGSFANQTLFQIAAIPGKRQESRRIFLLGQTGQAELTLALAQGETEILAWWDADGVRHDETWPNWNPWTNLVRELAGWVESPTPSTPSNQMGSEDSTHPTLSWQDTLRALELDDAVRRSIVYKRASILEYPEASEAVGFKGTMTLVGCGLLWIFIFLAILSFWIPGLGWLILPVLTLFLILQLLRWLVPQEGPVTSDQDQ